MFDTIKQKQQKHIECLIEGAWMVVREKYISKVKPFVNKDIIKVFVGVRRSGKTVLLSQI